MPIERSEYEACRGSPFLSSRTNDRSVEERKRDFLEEWPDCFGSRRGRGLRDCHRVDNTERFAEGNGSEVFCASSVSRIL